MSRKLDFDRTPWRKHMSVEHAVSTRSSDNDKKGKGLVLPSSVNKPWWRKDAQEAAE